MAIKTRSSTPRFKCLPNPSFVLLDVDHGWRTQLGVTRAVLCKREQDICAVLSEVTTDCLWISSGSRMTDELLRVVSQSNVSHDAGRRLGSLLMLESPRPKTIPFLRGIFGDIVGEAPQFKWLPEDQLCEVIAGTEEARHDVFLGGVIDTEFHLLTLVRGTLDRVTVPLSVFHPSGTSKPDFRRFELDDYGHTVRFGDYEASAEFVLYEADAEYRKRKKAKHRQEDKGFGSSLRRLRIQRGISQEDFPGINKKTIGRIERGEVEKPHGATLEVIAKTLGVDPDEIQSY